MLCLQSYRFFSLFSLIFYPEKSQEKSEEEKSEVRREQKEKPHFRATFLFGGEQRILSRCFRTYHRFGSISLFPVINALLAKPLFHYSLLFLTSKNPAAVREE